ncbi:MAG: hypothetical protein JWQ73_2567, partial [Variovorax sp.]|nr:hypothetical protein [Variovorax sp.]
MAPAAIDRMTTSNTLKTLTPAPATVESPAVTAPGRGIAIVGSPGPVMESVRKILLLQGNAPLVFHSPDDLQALGTRA